MIRGIRPGEFLEWLDDRFRRALPMMIEVARIAPFIAD
jgi:hypothetical protein